MPPDPLKSPQPKKQLLFNHLANEDIAEFDFMKKGTPNASDLRPVFSPWKQNSMKY